MGNNMLFKTGEGKSVHIRKKITNKIVILVLLFCYSSTNCKNCTEIEKKE